MILMVMSVRCDKCGMINAMAGDKLPRGWVAGNGGEAHFCKRCSAVVIKKPPADKSECDDCAFSDWNEECCWPETKGKRPCE